MRLSLSTASRMLCWSSVRAGYSRGPGCEGIQTPDFPSDQKSDITLIGDRYRVLENSHASLD
jgi:hypothetical protein